MGNLCDCFDYPFLEEEGEANETTNVKALTDLWIGNLPALRAAQSMHETKKGQKIQQGFTSVVWSDIAVAKLREDTQAHQHMRLIANSPFIEMDRILDHLFLTGVGGVTVENLQLHKISIIVNATYEMPLLKRKNIVSVRIPVDDDPEDDIFPYLHDVTDFIYRASLENFRTVVHCLAGASRSTTVVLAYLVKHTRLSLKEAFNYVHAGRPCARPNMSFFQQLINFEKEIHGSNSVQMRDYPVEGGRVIHVPDLYRNTHPDLFEVEKKNQLRKYEVT